MTFASCKAIRKQAGTHHKVAGLLGVSHPMIARRERPNARFSEGKDKIQRVIRNTDYREHRQLVASGIVIAYKAGDDDTACRWLYYGREAHRAESIIEEAAAKAGL